MTPGQEIESLKCRNDLLEQENETLRTLLVHMQHNLHMTAKAIERVIEVFPDRKPDLKVVK